MLAVRKVAGGIRENKNFIDKALKEDFQQNQRAT
jgi:hypothetical protein